MEISRAHGASRGLIMKSIFSIAGHPIHPMMVALPVGLILWTFAASLIYIATGGAHMWYSVAFWTDLAAMIALLVAALPGFGDYLTMAIHTDARGLATIHMGVNVLTLLLFLAAFLIMLDDRATAGGLLIAAVVLQGVAAGLVTIGGWIGGEMVFRHHLAMIPDDAAVGASEQTRHAWHTRHA